MKERRGALKSIFGEGGESAGAWAFINNDKTGRQELYAHSKSVLEFSSNVPTVSKSLFVMYKGGVMSKPKYIALRNAGMADLLPYQKVSEHLKTMKRPTLFPFPSIPGHYTDMKEHLTMIIEYYLKRWEKGWEWDGKR